MKREFTVTVLATAMILSIGSATAQTQESDVTVNVSQVTELDVRPSALEYGASTGLQPGDSLTTSSGGYEHIEIANIGSEEIEEVSAEATMPSNQTFGATGLNTGEVFDTGNFVTVSTATASGSEYDLANSALVNQDNMHYLNRVEYVERTAPTYIKTESTDASIGSMTDTVEPEVGRFRVGGAEYFYTFYAENEGNSGTGDTWVLRIGETPHTSTQLGTVDFTNSGNDYTEYNSTDASDTGQITGTSYVPSQSFVDFNTSSDTFTGQSLLDDGAANSTAVSAVDGAEVRDYNLFLDFTNSEKTENHIARTSVNINLNNPSETDDQDYGEVIDAAQQPIFSSTTDGDRLQPGQSFPLDIGVQIPQGVAEDRINTGTVTVLASSTA